MKPGDLVFVDSFIDRTNKREQSFYDGKTPGCPKGVLHIPMDEPYSKGLRKVLSETAKDLGIPHHQKGTVVVSKFMHLNKFVWRKLKLKMFIN